MSRSDSRLYASRGRVARPVTAMGVMAGLASELRTIEFDGDNGESLFHYTACGISSRSVLLDAFSSLIFWTLNDDPKACSSIGADS
ncbi:MAG: hypothetical protein VXY07_11585 [Planctomycetota bacterium]|nr:hypothetical protein [Planctomycetota bacterium]